MDFDIGSLDLVNVSPPFELENYRNVLKDF